MATQKMTVRHFLILLTCITCTFGPAAITFSCPGLCYRPVANYLGCQVSDVSFYMSLVYFGEVVFSAPVGALLEKYDVRIICTIAALCTSLGIGMMSTYTQVWQWYISGIFMGFGEITMLWLMVAGLLNRWFKKNLGLCLGLSYAMTGIGGAVFNLIGQFILGPNLLYEETWRTLYLVEGVCAFFLSVPFTLFALRSYPEEVGLKAYGAPLGDGEVEHVDHESLPGLPASVALKKWYFWVLAIAGCVFNVAGIFPQHFTTYYQTLVACTADGQTIPELMIMSGTLEACCMAGMAVGKVTIGAIESKSIVAALSFGSICGVIGMLGVWFGGFDKFIPVLFFGGFIYGMCYPLVTTVLPFITRVLFGDRDYDKIYSYILIPVNLVGAFAASGLALIYQSVGWVPFFLVGIAAAVACWIIGMVVVKAGGKDYDHDKVYVG
ncbi:MAG: MFS transporter [Anaerotardibacter sp.]